ncbi:DNA-binding NarL/FixJ family response regulator [Desulfitispora alkaliphila]|uniref:LuxR C-terminal-related transcriptional regulator n=1 Tax=Desulfitispora alkaliphila TaxID=622674 RepID=UPI003D229E0C
MAEKKIRLLIGEGQFLIKQGLLQIFAEEDYIEVIGEAEACFELVKRARLEKPDLILFNLSLEGMDIECIKEIRREQPDVKFILLINSNGENESITKFMQAGVTGYLAPSFDRQQLIRAVELTAQGKVFLHPEIAAKLLEHIKGWMYLQTNREEEVKLQLLTKREREVLGLVAQGRDNIDIASNLFISEKTVRNHLSNIFRKLGFKDRTQAALWAVRVGIVSIQESPYL